MAILTIDDKPLYFPSLDLSGNELTAAVFAAQAIAEGSFGANRFLEVTKYVEILPVRPSFQSCFLTYSPYVEPLDILLQPQTLYVEGRVGNIQDRWLVVQRPPSQWQDLSISGQTNYVFDPEDGQLSMSTSAFPVTEVRVTYFAGFDFTDNTSPDVRRIKSALASILNFQQSKAGRNISVARVDYQSVTYGSTKVEEALQPELQIFAAYRPRIFH